MSVPSRSTQQTAPTPVHQAKARPTRSLEEVGVSGLNIQGGRVRDEFLPALQGDKAAKVYREMRDNDTTCGALLFGIEQEVKRSAWSVDANDAPPERADFLDSCMHDTSQPWSAIVSEALSMCQYGWAYMEIVYKERHGEDADPPSQFTDGLLGWRKFALRSHETLLRWEIDETGGIQGFTQRLVAGGERTIPIDLALLFRTTHFRNNPEGRSLLRTAYRSWWYKKRTEENEAIGIDRDLCGLPVMEMPAKNLLPDAPEAVKAAVEEWGRMLANIRNDEQAYMLLPQEYEGANPLYKFSLAGTQSRRLYDTTSIINRYSIGILQSVLADVVMIGHEDNGSKALSVTKADMFTQALQSIVDEIRDVFNRFAVPRLMRLNGWSGPYPQFRTEPLERIDPVEFSQVVKNYADSAAAMQTDPALDEYVRERVGFPEREDDGTLALTE